VHVSERQEKGRKEHPLPSGPPREKRKGGFALTIPATSKRERGLSFSERSWEKGKGGKTFFFFPNEGKKKGQRGRSPLATDLSSTHARERRTTASSPHYFEEKRKGGEPSLVVRACERKGLKHRLNFWTKKREKKNFPSSFSMKRRRGCKGRLLPFETQARPRKRGQLWENKAGRHGPGRKGKRRV